MLLEKVKADTSLQEKLKVAANTNAVDAIAKETGYMISADDLSNAESKLSGEELAGVEGGGYIEGSKHICVSEGVGVCY